MIENVPVPVTTGFTWTSAFTGGSFVTLLGLLIRQIGPWRKQRDETEEKLRNDLVKRVDKLEKTLDRERARHEAQRSLERHVIANLTQCLDAVLMLLETAPEKTAEVVARVRTMREAQIKAEAVEKAAIQAAEILSDANDE